MPEASSPSRADAPVKCERIRSKHCLYSFVCGERGIDRYARDTAYKLDQTGRARVLGAYNEATCCGFVSISFSSQTSLKLLEKRHQEMWSAGAPVVHIAYLAVDGKVQGQGLGKILLVEALKAAYAVSQVVPVYGVSLNSLNERTTKFYEGMGFRIAPKEGANPLMMLPIWTVNELFG